MSIYNFTTISLINKTAALMERGRPEPTEGIGSNLV